jgi:hypothetical protein
VPCGSDYGGSSPARPKAPSHDRSASAIVGSLRPIVGGWQLSPRTRNSRAGRGSAGHRPLKTYLLKIPIDDYPFSGPPRNSLPPRKPITVYRGCSQDHIEGMASTTDPNVADFFAMRGGMSTGTQGVATGVINKRDFGFYFVNAGTEAEIVCKPQIVRWGPLSNEQLHEIGQRRQAANAEKAAWWKLAHKIQTAAAAARAGRRLMRHARITQAEIERAIRAAKKAGLTEIEIKIGDGAAIRIPLAPNNPIADTADLVL